MGQEPAIAPGGQQKVGIAAAQERAQPDQQAAGIVQGIAGDVIAKAGQEIGWLFMSGIAVGPEHQGAQRRGIGIHIPGGVQRFDGFDQAIVTGGHPAAGQGEDIRGSGIAQGQGHIGVVVGQGRKAALGGVEDSSQSVGFST